MVSFIGSLINKKDVSTTWSVGRLDKGETHFRKLKNFIRYKYRDRNRYVGKKNLEIDIWDHPRPHVN